ncbi:EAL domain-containing protein [Tianweitania sp. BSSL-BM11]|uniref:EAL domain-containing protein n=1 Tax=Tianweitania aestuarii TaxID=2814886 RepID=A0ABS5RW65_9HYPH|nr:EAL domain-containing protein [Tianweitania aestuarii]MBS9721311.1 EAL domain-containing protein [Tianweitania aestuarii]
MALRDLLLQLRNGLTARASDELVVAQLDALKKRIPILYAVLSINTLAVAITHQQVHAVLSRYVPAVLVTLMVARLIHWQRLQTVTIEAAEARRILRRLTPFTAILSSVTLAWAMGLYLIDERLNTDATRHMTQHGHAALFVGLTVISCINLLMHARVPALVTTVFVIPPFALFLLWNGSRVEQAVAINLVLVASAMVYVVFVFARDFEDLVLSRSRLSQMNAYQTRLANTDALTGLANRRRFYGVLEELSQIEAASTVLVIDLDGFKQINDLHGHAIGDEVLREIAVRIARETPDSLCTARIGGDEFAVVFNKAFRDAKVQAYGERLIAACNAPVVLEALTLSVGASVGVYNDCDPKGAAHGRHIERADYALFHAKEAGRNQVAIFRAEHEVQRKRGSHVEQVLRAAKLEEELYVLFQPIVDAHSRQLIGFEALARWNSPVLGQVFPSEFIPIAERSDVIHAVTRSVMNKAVAQASRWPAQISLKVNLSARDLSPPRMLELLEQFEHSGFDAARMSFEVTETALGSLDMILDTVALVKTKGIALAVDDFGIGYSSLSYIHKLKPDLIKIDRSFVSRLGKNDGAEAIIETIVAMSRNVKASCLAEGVEEEAQIDALEALGCDQLQGFAIGYPMSGAEALVLIETGEKPPSG